MAQDPTPERWPVLVVRAVDELSREPVAGVAVHAFPAQGDSRSVFASPAARVTSGETDASGTLELRLAPHQSWKLWLDAERSGHVGTFRYHDPLPLDARRTLDVALEPRRRVTGRIVDESGRPLEGVRVHTPQTSSVPEEGGGWTLLPQAEARSAPDGTFALLAPSRQRLVWVEADGRAPLIASLPEEPARDLGDVTMQRNVDLRVRLVDGLGRPLADQWVAVSSHDAVVVRSTARSESSWIGARSWSARSDGDGSFTIAGLPIGVPLDLLVRNGTWLRRERKDFARLVSGGDSVVTVILPTPVRLTGRLRGLLGLPIGGYTLRFLGEHGDKRQVRTEWDGRFVVEPLASGSWSVWTEDTFGPTINPSRFYLDPRKLEKHVVLDWTPGLHWFVQTGVRLLLAFGCLGFFGLVVAALRARRRVPSKPSAHGA